MSRATRVLSSIITARIRNMAYKYSTRVVADSLVVRMSLTSANPNRDQTRLWEVFRKLQYKNGLQKLHGKDKVQVWFGIAM